MIRLVQLQNGADRRVAIVDEPHLRLLGDVRHLYSLVQSAITKRMRLADVIRDCSTNEMLNYEAVYRANSPWKLLIPIDHPEDPSKCLVSGTGLTHLGSAKNRQAMHAAPAAEAVTDSMKMFRWGVEGGKPAAGKIGAAPEWFYKGNGTILRAHGEPLLVPIYAEDGGEEAEIAGVYLIAADGKPHRIGMTIGNEFSDHRFEKRNYLNLAGSKIRNCSIGPELVIDPKFQSVPGLVTIERAGQPIWSKPILTGEAEMCHSLANIEHHHFKFETHRRPGDLHVHFYGADALSFGDGIELTDGDVMEVSFEEFGRPLRNPLQKAVANDGPISVVPLS